MSDSMTMTSAKPAPSGVQSKPPFENMVWIPSGTFLMGSDKHYPEEAPAHEVTVEGFWMDEHTVTNEEFRRFVEATKHVTSAERAPRAEDYPGREAGIARAGLRRFQQTAPAGRSQRLLQLVDLCSRRQLAASGGTGKLFEGKSETPGGARRLRGR